MPRSSTAAAPDPSAIDASLHLLVHRLADELADGTMAPALLHVALEPAGLQLGYKDLDGDHPSAYLLGFVAPERWYALGSAAAGYAYDVADRSTLAPARHRVHTVTLLSRSGELAHRTIVDGNPTLTEQLSGEEVVGEQVDLLRLALELPTSPPPCDISVYWAIQWLGNVLALPSPSSWDDVAGAHPALDVRRDDDASAPPVDELVPAATAFVRVFTWRRLHGLARAGSFVVPGLEADDVHWLDEGAFARWLLARSPTLSTLRRQARDALPRPLGDRLDATLDALGIPATAWPEPPAGGGAEREP